MMNNGPSKEIPANALWEQILALPRPHRLVDFPRLDPITGEPMGQLVIQVLTQSEQMASMAAAEKVCRALLKDGEEKNGIGYQDLYKNASSVELLFRACRRPDDLKWPFFPSPLEMRNALTPDEIGVLVTQYIRVQAEVGPIVATMSADEMEAWVKRLAEGASSAPLALLSWEAMSELVMLMARRLSPFLTDTSLPGSPPDESPAASAEA